MNESMEEGRKGPGSLQRVRAAAGLGQSSCVLHSTYLLPGLSDRRNTQAFWELTASLLRLLHP